VEARGVDLATTFEQVTVEACQAKQLPLVAELLKRVKESGFASTSAHVALRTALKLGESEFAVEILRQLKWREVDWKRLYVHSLEREFAPLKLIDVQSELFNNIGSGSAPDAPLRKSETQQHHQETEEKKEPAEQAAPPLISRRKELPSKPHQNAMYGEPDVLKHFLNTTSSGIVAHGAALRETYKAEETRKDAPKILDHLLYTFPDAQSAYLHVLRMANNSKLHKLTVQIHEHMATHDVKPSIEVYDVILRSCVRANDLDTALAIESALHRHGLVMTESVALSLIKCAAKRGECDTVVRVLKKTQNAGLEPTMGVREAARLLRGA
jgi:hypothetical protein